MLFSFKYFKDLYIAFFMLMGVVLVGTFGFMIVEGYTLIEGFYMTIITVSTVGFEEVKPLSSAGRLFTSFLIITSFGTFAFAVSSITKYLVEGKYRSYFKTYRVEKNIEKLSGHTIVCGYGRNGEQAVKTLQAHNQKFVVIENVANVIERNTDLDDILFIDGDATNEQNIIKAGVHNASALISTLPKDSDNLYVVLSARELNGKLNIISRASKLASDRKLRIAGANNVVMPDKVGGEHMAQLVTMPDVVEFLDHIKIQGRAEINLEEISFDNLPGNFKYKTIRELEGKFKTGVMIIGFKTPEGEYIINPSADLELIPGSNLFVLGKPEQIARLNEVFGLDLDM